MKYWYSHNLDEKKLKKIKKLPKEDIITFDGVHKSVYENWNDILEFRPVILFPVGSWVGKFGYCDWNELITMSTRGATIGFHTWNHKEPSDKVSQNEVLPIFPTNHFALPYGRFTKKYLEFVKTKYKFIYGTNLEGDGIILRHEL